MGEKRRRRGERPRQGGGQGGIKQKRVRERGGECVHRGGL